MKPILEIQNISKRFSINHQSGGYLSLRERMGNVFKFNRQLKEEFWALKEVSFDVHPGESVGIIGRNGAGKSTLLKILSKITPPTSGKILSRGRIASLLEVGTGFHPELTGRENIFFNGSLLGMKRKEIEAKFDEIVDFSGVEKFLDTPLKHYSSGMQLRLAFAVAAFLEPEILIIDEVLAVGDAEFQKKCMGKMEGISKEGRTILFVSHNMDAITQLCSRVVYLSEGKKFMESTDVKRLISNYLHSGNDEVLETRRKMEIQSEFFFVNEFGLYDSDGLPFFTGIQYSSEITISIKGEILSPHMALNFGFIIYDEGNRKILWSFCNDQKESFSGFLKPERFHLTTALPSRYLNEGNYRIELVSVLHNQKWLIEPGTGLSIPFQIDGGFNNVIVTPYFAWRNIG